MYNKRNRKPELWLIQDTWLIMKILTMNILKNKLMEFNPNQIDKSELIIQINIFIILKMNESFFLKL